MQDIDDSFNELLAYLSLYFLFYVIVVVVLYLITIMAHNASGPYNLRPRIIDITTNSDGAIEEVISKIIIDHFKYIPDESQEKRFKGIMKSVKTLVVNKLPQKERKSVMETIRTMLREAFSNWDLYEDPGWTTVKKGKNKQAKSDKKMDELDFDMIFNQEFYDTDYLISEEEDLNKINQQFAMMEKKADNDHQKKYESDLEKALKQSEREEEKRQQEMKEQKLVILKDALAHALDSVWGDPVDADYQQIAELLDNYEKTTGMKFNVGQEKRTWTTINGKSQIILDIISVLNDRIEIIIDTFSQHITDIIMKVNDITDVCIYEPTIYKQPLDLLSDFTAPIGVFPLVTVEVKGDGNCLWNSVSMNLFGDYSMMESLRLLTAYTIHTDPEFKNFMKREHEKSSYRHALTYDHLIRASAELQVWGDELHIMALSLALRRPIYSYGSLEQLNFQVSSYDDLLLVYETEDLINHYRYIGDESHADRSPILLHYNGFNHYNCVLRTHPSVKPLVPKTQLLEPIYKIENGDKDIEDQPEAENVPTDSNHKLLLESDLDKIDDYDDEANKEHEQQDQQISQSKPLDEIPDDNVQRNVTTHHSDKNSLKIAKKSQKRNDASDVKEWKQKYDECFKRCQDAINKVELMTTHYKSMETQLRLVTKERDLLKTKLDKIAQEAQCKTPVNKIRTHSFNGNSSDSSMDCDN